MGSTISAKGVDRILALDFDTIYVENEWSFRRVRSRTKHIRYSICYGDKCAEIAVTEMHTRANFTRQLNERMRRLKRLQRGSCLC